MPYAIIPQFLCDFVVMLDCLLLVLAITIIILIHYDGINPTIVVYGHCLLKQI